MENEIFYHYFSGNDYSLKNLQEGNITFSHVNFFNDPCEIALFPDDKPFVTKNSDMRYKYELLLRVFCFSKTFLNPLMWGHYGNSHKGFCVGYDLNDIKKIPKSEENFCFNAVSYSNDIPLFSEEAISQGMALYCKSSDWKAEQEWRAIISLADNDRYIISEAEFLKAKKKWVEAKLFFEKAVDSHLRLQSPLTPTIKEAKENVKRIRKNTENFEIENYAYSPLIDRKTNRKLYGKYPMRIERSLKAKVIYVGLRTPDDLRKSLKKYANENGIEIYEIGIENGKYSLAAKRIIV